MKISEIFYSIQGEGILAGVPSIFIRTSGCNLRCTWCDTLYTSWAPEGEALEVGTILERIGEFPARHAVVTGGEPMLFEETVELTKGLKRLGLHITVETAGTIFKPVECDLMSISPKLANSRPEGRWSEQHERSRYQPDVLKQLMRNYNYQLKFVIANPGDLDEVNTVVKDLGAAREHVLLMPEGTDSLTLAERGRWLTQICLREGFRYSPRLHVDLWGATRGR